MNEQFIDRVIKILIEHTLRTDNLGGRGASGGRLMNKKSRDQAAHVKRVQRGLDRIGVPPAKGQSNKSYQGNPTGIKLGNNTPKGVTTMKPKSQIGMHPDTPNPHEPKNLDLKSVFKK